VLGTLLLFSTLQSPLHAAGALDFQPSPEDRAAWLDEAKYGLFIHWGLYSQLERGEWVMFNRKIPIEEYGRLSSGSTRPAGSARPSAGGLPKRSGRFIRIL
jgi:alpha-L-fucosidase